ncbi:MAG: arsenate reductase (glutaredoxin) [Candidatus Latescibacterota bacterium]|jgi:arsenate reductase
MSDVIIYHNPRCSKSRATLALLRERGIVPEVIEYLKNPPDEHDLARILGMLELEPIALIRKGEAEYVDLGLEEIKEDRAALIQHMITHPILIDRPIVVKNNQARIGRPPEKVLEIL